MNFDTKFYSLAILCMGLIAMFAVSCRHKNEEPAQANAPSAGAASYPSSNVSDDEDTGSTSNTVTGSNSISSPASGVQTTYSGLKYEVLRPGTGERPTKYNHVKVHYHGYLPNGTVFDSSVQRGSPVILGLTNVIPGWQEGIPLMREGAKYRFTVPPQLGYGARGAPPKIGPNQTLMFDVELIKVQY